MNIASFIKPGIWGFVWNHFSIFSRPRVKNDKMRPDHPEMLGPWCSAAPTSWHFPATQIAQHPNSSYHLSCFLPFIRLQLIFSGMKLPRNLGFYVNFSFWIYLALKPRPASLVSLRLRSCLMRGNCSPDYLVVGFLCQGICTVKLNTVISLDLLCY